MKISVSKKIWEIKNRKKIESIEQLKNIILENRNIEDKNSFLESDYIKNSHSPYLFQDMKKVLNFFLKCKKEQKKILIYGDYDVDGVTSSVLMVDLLKKIGIKVVDPYLPSRLKEGYGLNKKVLERLKGQYDLIITVDCGISNYEEVEYAKNLGYEVIITDHHEPPKKIPKALALINPKIKNSKYPFKDLAGVGVVFKLIQAVYESDLFKNNNIRKGYEKWYLDLVALGTVADCMELKNENRIFVKYGLIVISKTKRIGLREIFKCCSNKKENFTASDIGFFVAPRLNAAGRIGHAKTAYKLLTSINIAQTYKLIEELNFYNDKRRNITEKIYKQIKSNFEINHSKVLIASSDEWQEGVVGLVAGRLAEDYYKPVFLFSEGKNKMTGSVRCINKNINIINEIAKHKDLLVKFGGHAKAAGLTIKKNNYEKFKIAISKDLSLKVKGYPKLTIDSILNEKILTIDNILKLKELEPYGNGNDSPLFYMPDVKVLDVKQIGKENKHLVLSVINNKRKFKTLGFGWGNKVDYFKLLSSKKIDIAFEPIVDIWNHHKQLSLKLIDVRK